MATQRSRPSRPSKSEADPSRSASSFHDVQRSFNSRIKPPVDPVRHEKTLVLILYWQESNLDVKPEVSFEPTVPPKFFPSKEVAIEIGLRETLVGYYGFQVSEVPIQGNHPRGPAIEVDKAITDLIYYSEHDHTLYIIYYAGHGWITGNRSDEEEEFKIGASNTMKARRKWEQNEVVWHQVEQKLGRQSADILVIFDCCYAGWLRDNRRAPQDFSFEYLAACGKKERAYGPDHEYSFTKALVKALKDLSVLEGGFSTATLLDKVKEVQHFLGAPVGELHPEIFPRELEKRNKAHVWIQPDSRMVPRSAQHNFREDTADGQGEWENYYIRLSFNRKQAPKGMEHLGDSFNELVTTHSGQGLRFVELLQSPSDLRRADQAIYIWAKQVRSRKSQTELRREMEALPLPAGRLTNPDSGVDVVGADAIRLDTAFCDPREPGLPMATSAIIDTPVLTSPSEDVSVQDEDRPNKRRRTD